MGRRRLFLVGALTLCLVATPGAHAEQKLDVRVAYLKVNAIPLRTHDPADRDFKDLQPLKKLWKDVRIVQLGEETHGDGACFLAKTRLIQFLHQEMGFDVLAFESGIYDCAKAWQALNATPRKTVDPIKAMGQGVFGIWMQSHELKPLAGYLHKAAGSPKPLELCGFDCQLTGPASGEHLAQELSAVAERALPAAPPAKVWEHVVGYLGDAKRSMNKTQHAARQRDLAAMAAALREEGKATDRAARDRAWWAQVCTSLAAQLANQFKQRSSRSRGGPEATNARDAQMADNLIWLADQHYKDRKVIVWAATFHLIRNAPKLKALKARVDYANTVPMGHRVAKHFGNSCYTLGFTAYEGEIGQPWNTPSRLSAAPPDTLEHWMKEAGFTEAIVDLRTPAAKGHWLHEPFVARPLGYSLMRGSGWHETLDGLYFQRTMTPSTRNGYTPPPAVQDMRPLLDSGWANIKSGLLGGNIWAAKWTLADAFVQWQRHAQPSHAAIEAQETIVRAWMKEHADEGGVAWRGHAVLADMAAARDAPTAQLAALDEALRAFPVDDQTQPMKTSQFQHLANQRAWLVLETESFRKALMWFTGLLAKDRRFRYAHLQAWSGHASEDQVKALEKAVRKAYGKRAKRFKDLAAEIEGFRSAL